MGLLRKTITETLKDYIKYENKTSLGFPFRFLVLEVCEYKPYTNLNVCKYSGVINELTELYNKYYYRLDEVEKINDHFYDFFNILYLIYSNKDSVCDIRPLIHKDSHEIMDILVDTEIIIYEQNAVPMYKYKHSIIHFITLKETSELYGNHETTYKIVYNDELPNLIKQCMHSEKFIVININVIQELGSHANALIYNPNTKEVEIFEPKLNLDLRKFEPVYKEVIYKIFGSNVIYVSSNKYITQNIQELQEKEICIERGHCVSWTIWYIEHRLKLPKMTAKQAFEYIYNTFIKNLTYKTEDKELSKLIANYVKYIRAQRATVLKTLPRDSKERLLLEKEWKL